MSRDIFIQIRLLRDLSNLTSNVSRDRASPTSLGNLGQCFTTLRVKNFFLIPSLNLLSFSLKPSPLFPSQLALLKNLCLYTFVNLSIRICAWVYACIKRVNACTYKHRCVHAHFCTCAYVSGCVQAAFCKCVHSVLVERRVHAHAGKREVRSCTQPCACARSVTGLSALQSRSSVHV